MHDKGIYIAMYRRALLNVYVSLVSALYCYYALIAIKCKMFWSLILRYCLLVSNVGMSVA